VRTLALLLGLLLLAPAPAHALNELDAQALVASARAQIGVTVSYDPSYQRLRYPGGDVALDRGVCSDVLIRALRGQGVDLQRLLHEDMRAYFAAYPTRWGLRRPDRNIDHRRVPNLERYFQRLGSALALKSGAPIAPQPGDVISFTLPGNLPHIGIVSDKKAWFSARYLILHNVGAGTKEEDVMTRWPVVAHFRLRGWKNGALLRSE
jgi:uncharacterized protein